MIWEAYYYSSVGLSLLMAMGATWGAFTEKTNDTPFQRAAFAAYWWASLAISFFFGRWWIASTIKPFSEWIISLLSTPETSASHDIAVPWVIFSIFCFFSGLFLQKAIERITDPVIKHWSTGQIMGLAIAFGVAAFIVAWIASGDFGLAIIALVGGGSGPATALLRPTGKA